MYNVLNVSFANLRRVSLIIVLMLLAACGSAEDRARSHYDRGMKLLEQQDYVKAALELRNAVKLKKDFAGAWRGLSQIEEHNRNLEALAGILRTLVELDPADIE